MREVSRTADDLAIDAAKEKLRELVRRPGYEQAKQPLTVPRRQKIGVSLVTALVVALGIASLVLVSNVYLKWILGFVFGVLAIVLGLGTLGSFLPDKSKTWDVAVLGKSIDPDEGKLLDVVCADGAAKRLRVGDEEIFDLLRAGDVGVARVDDQGKHVTITQFTRL